MKIYYTIFIIIVTMSLACNRESSTREVKTYFTVRSLDFKTGLPIPNKSITLQSKDACQSIPTELKKFKTLDDGLASGVYYLTVVNNNNQIIDFDCNEFYNFKGEKDTLYFPLESNNLAPGEPNDIQVIFKPYTVLKLHLKNQHYYINPNGIELLKIQSQLSDVINPITFEQETIDEKTISTYANIDTTVYLHTLPGHFINVKLLNPTNNNNIATQFFQTTSKDTFDVELIY